MKKIIAITMTVLVLGLLAGCSLLGGFLNDYLSFKSDYDPWTQGIDSAVTLSANSIGNIYKVVVARKPSSLDIKNPSVWGTNIYTSDSRIGPAAVHAGKITTSGGTVYVEIMAGRDSYTGSTANGVTTIDYESWNYSFRFVDK